MSRFVRPSKYRHVFGTATKRDHCYDNLRITNSAWDTNLVAVNPRYLAVNWSAGGGGAFAVVPLDYTGKLPGEYPLFNGHAGPVLDTAFSPFNDSVIASASEDTRAMVWVIPEDLTELEESIDKPAVVLKGHGRKVGHVLFNPVAQNVLATTSADLTVRLWDIEKGVQHQQLTGHADSIQTAAWNWNGTLLATHCRDKKIRIFDARANQVVQEANGHQGIKGARLTWLGDTPRIASTGFSRTSERQLYVWDAANLESPLRSMAVDISSGILMPFYDPDCRILYLAGKGDGNIRYYEFENDEMYYLAEYKSAEPQRGMAAMPKRGLHTPDCEVMRFYKVTASLVEPVSFTVPRRSDAFQSDIYPPALGYDPALTADQYFAGQTAEPVLLTFDENYEYSFTPRPFEPQYATESRPAAPPACVPAASPTRSKPASTATVTPRATVAAAQPPSPVSTPRPGPTTATPPPASPALAAAPPAATPPAAPVASSAVTDDLQALKAAHETLQATYAAQQGVLQAMEARLKSLELAQKELASSLSDSRAKAKHDPESDREEEWAEASEEPTPDVDRDGTKADI
ncbi:Coronin-like protein crn1 [Tieghemiomyces parasiticus]|uniref:Coronin n=1 Tax=Tieghemiomyces parasiticus TaxID=78921 RepID=A0A9W7ZP64_9FUNG|nr:Coronin-like protein crn1 [Tieghemiomyces parasiticus]